MMGKEGTSGWKKLWNHLSFVLSLIGAGLFPFGSVAAQDSAATLDHTTLPTSYGVYVVEDANPRGLETSEVKLRVGLTVGGSIRLGGYAVDGLDGTPTQINPKAHFILYDFNVDPKTLKLAKLEYWEAARAGDFNVARTDCRFLPSVSGGTHCDDVVPLNMWRRGDENVAVQVEPIQGTQGMYRLRPQSLMTPGKYALYFEGALRGDIYVTKSLETGRAAFFLEVGSSSARRALSQDSTANVESRPKVLNVVYHVNSTGQFTPLERQTADVKTKQKLLSFGGAKTVAVIRGEHSSVQLPAGRSNDFLVRLAAGADPGKFLLYAFSPKPGVREVVLTDAGVVTREGGMGTVPFDIVGAGDDSYKFITAPSLGSGEYCFSATDSQETFCFSLRDPSAR